jgi:hypothetical protein
MVRKRQSTENQFKYVKRVRTMRHGYRWQARAWLSLPIGSVNLGYHPTEQDAWEAVSSWIKAGGDPVRGLPEGILPKWVSQLDGQFWAILRQGKRRVKLGPFDDPAMAFEAALQCWQHGGMWTKQIGNPFYLIKPPQDATRCQSGSSGQLAAAVS